MKKLLSFLLVFAILSPIFPTAFVAQGAYTPQYQDKADILKGLGLFQGNDQGYQLEKKPSRVEASVMLVRLLGKESEAMGSDVTHPFTDVPEWANKYVGYLYQKGLSKGTSKTTFGSANSCEAKMYVTFVLRALGYSDVNQDFSYNDSIDFAYQIGMISKAYQKMLGMSVFLRDDMVVVSYRALLTKMAEQEVCLLQTLIDQNVVDKTIATSYANIYLSGKMLGDAQNNTFSTNSYSEEHSLIYSIKTREDLPGTASDIVENLKTEEKTLTEYQDLGNNEINLSFKYWMYENGDLEMWANQFYTKGYLYYRTNGLNYKKKIDFDEFYYGEKPENLVNIDQGSLEVKEVEIGPMIDNRRPAIIEKSKTGGSLIKITYLKEEFSRNAIIGELKNVFEEKYRDQDYKDAEVSCSDIEVTYTINKDGCYAGVTKKYTLSMTKEDLSEQIQVSDSIVYNKPGEQIVVYIPDTRGYIDVTSKES